MCIWKKNYDPEKLVWPPDPREAFYLTILQAELRVTTLLTTLCIDGWGASGGGLTDLILRCWSIGKSKPFKEIISPFHRRLLLNLRLWRVSDCEELVGGQSHEIMWLTFKGLMCIKYKDYQLSSSGSCNNDRQEEFIV